MRAEHIEHNGGNHFATSVEIDEVPANHPQATKQIQHVSIKHTESIFEEWSFTVTNPDSGTFKLNLLDPTVDPPAYWQSNPISASASSWDVRNGIYRYYRHKFGTDITVVKTYFDEANVETEDSSLGVTVKYTITLNKLINGASANAATASPVTSTATFLVTPPSQGVLSTPPLAGKYTITCTDTDGIEWTTPEMGYSSYEVWTEYWMTNGIPFLANKITVTNAKEFGYAENGVSLNIIMSGIHYGPAACTIQSGVDEPITGNDPLFAVEITREYGASLILEPIPIEFLSTDATSPQVLISVNGIDAVCPGFNCDYMYVPTTAVIATTTLSGSVLTIVGTDLPTIESITFGTVNCAVTSSSETEIVCALDHTPLAGEWQA
jgi:hypothetical protein